LLELIRREHIRKKQMFLMFLDWGSGTPGTSEKKRDVPSEAFTGLDGTLGTSGTSKISNSQMILIAWAP